MKLKAVFLSVVAGLLVVTGVQAAEIVAPNKDNPNISIGSTQTHRNLYTAGSNVNINSTTQGDLAAAGGMIAVEGPVEQDAMLAGGTINLNGSVGGDARLAGGNITVSGPVSGDLVIAGGNINVTGRSNIGGDLLAAAGNLIIDAPVRGAARIAGGNITINSRVEGDVYARSGERLEFGPQAVVTGTVYHKGPREAVVQPGAQVGNIQYTPYRADDRAGRDMRGIATAGFIIGLLANLAVAFILYGLFRRFLPDMSEAVFRHPWQNLGLGLAGLILVPIVAILLLLVIVGYYAAFLLGLAYVLLLALANILAAVATGYLILGWLIKPRERIVAWQAIVVGVVVWHLLRLIPVAGWIIMLVIFLMVLGSLLRMGWHRLPRREADVPQP